MNVSLYLIFSFIISSGVQSELFIPKGYILQKNDNREMYITKNNKIIVHPNIVLLGSNENYIVGCSEGKEEDINVSKNIYPGYFILPLHNENLIQVISKQNWEWFKTKHPELSRIKLTKTSNKECEYVYTGK